MIVLYFFVACLFQFHFILEFVEDFFLFCELLVYLRHFLVVILLKDDLSLLLGCLYFSHLLFVKHVISAVVKNLDSEEALLELTLRIQCVILRLFRNDLKRLVKDTIAVDHAFVDVFRLFDEFLKLNSFFAALVVHQILTSFVKRLSFPLIFSCSYLLLKV